MTYKHLDNYWNMKVLVKYVMDCLVMCVIRVHTSHRAYFTENILNIKELTISFSRALLTVSSDLYLRNTAPPLRVVAVEALHHHITALSVGIHRVLSVTPYFFSLKSN